MATAFAVALSSLFQRHSARVYRRGIRTTRRLCTMSTRKSSRVSLGAHHFVDVIPILSDNFCYIIGDSDSGGAIAIDPAAPGDVLSAINKAGLSLTAVLTTHHHWDHSGGNEDLRRQFPSLPIFALSSDASRIPAASTLIENGATAPLPGTSLHVRALHTPCHTTGHACYVINVAAGRSAVFTGDTLFVGGCGKFFEGDGAMMQRSLNETLAALPDDTLVFCGHEYTVSNLRFALSIEPHNEALIAKMHWAKAQVADGSPTVPSTIGDEKRFNPFMRTAVPAVAAKVQCEGEEAQLVMGALRRAKNNFRG